MALINPAHYFSFNADQQQAAAAKGFLWIAELENTGLTVKINNYDSTPYISFMKPGRNKAQHYVPMREKEYMTLLDCGDDIRDKLDECREYIIQKYGKVIDDNTRNNSVLVPKKKKKLMKKAQGQRMPKINEAEIKLEQEDDEQEE
jgi:hypothetical protein